MTPMNGNGEKKGFSFAKVFLIWQGLSSPSEREHVLTALLINSPGLEFVNSSIGNYTMRQKRKYGNKRINSLPVFVHRI